jgi:Mn2+/Fe2+ NRAMP family transporter
MLTNAAIFYGKENAPELKSAVDVAVQLKPLFGVWAQVVFGIGIFAGAISSFLVNALIGGHILADGLGMGDRITSKWTRHFTTLALLTGMVVGVLSISTGLSRVTMIVIAQALTVVGVPALALALIYLGVLKHRENRQAVPRWILAAATAGLITTSLIAARTVHTIIETVARW